MTQHLLPDMDLAFTAHLRNCFLIREPGRILASYAKVRPQFTLEELGFPQQFELFKRECDRLGVPPPVLDASTTLSDPEGVLRALCDALAIPFEDNMLSWPAGPRASDGVWAPYWYTRVLASHGFDSPSGQEALSKGLGRPGLNAKELDADAKELNAKGSDAQRPDAADALKTLTAGQCAMAARADAFYQELRPFALTPVT